MDFVELLEFIGSDQSGNGPQQPGMSPTEPSAVIGASLARIDGPLKTTGSANYAADYHFPHMAYAVPVCATIANGTITSLDTSAAEKMPGVLLVLHHGNICPLFRMTAGGRSRTSEARPPFEDEKIYYWGQYVAVAVAETFEQAQAAAAAVKVQYAAAKANVSTKLDDTLPEAGAPGGRRIGSKHGDAEAAFTSAAVQIDATYSTPAETHNPMEMHATTAVWQNGSFPPYESSPGAGNHLN